MLRFLIGAAGTRSLARVALFMVIASLTEGIGLLMLVPIVQLVANNTPAGLTPAWLASFASLPLSVLLAGFVTLVALRAAIMLAVLTERRALSLALIRRLRNTVQAAVLSADWRWLSGQRSADYGSLIVGEADRIGRLVDRALAAAATLITLTALVVAALWLTWKLTLITLFFGIATAVVVRTARKRHESHGARFSDAHRRLQQHVANGLSHLRAARILGAEDMLKADFNRAARDLERAETDYNIEVNKAQFGMQAVAAVMLAIIVWIGLRQMDLPLALLIPVLAIFARIVPLLDGLQSGWRSWRFCEPALRNLFRTVREADAVAETPALRGAENIEFTHTLALDEVTVCYLGRDYPVFQRFSCSINAGSVVAITGPSGSGKSTLADLFAGLLRPDSGEVLVDGIALEGERTVRWRQQVAYVEQQPHLIDGSIAQNVSWGLCDVTQSQVVAALSDAAAHFVFALPQGIETIVGEQGRALSGGERQRISFARALVRRPSLVVLDEVTAALGGSHESEVARTIERLRGSCTFIILGHRPALLALADHTIELGGGHSGESGE